MKINEFQQIIGLAMKKGMKTLQELSTFLNNNGLNMNRDAGAVIQALKAVA